MNQQLTITTSYLFDMPPVVASTTCATDGRGHDGSYEEIMFLAHARRRDYSVFLPVGHAQRADVVVWKPPYRPITIQVKRGQMKGDAWMCRVGASRGGKQKRALRSLGRDVSGYRPYREGDFDVLAIFHPPTEGFYFWNLRDVCHQRGVAIPQTAQLNNWHVIEEALAS